MTPRARPPAHFFRGPRCSTAIGAAAPEWTGGWWGGLGWGGVEKKKLEPRAAAGLAAGGLGGG